MAARRGPTYMRVVLGNEIKTLREQKRRRAEENGDDTSHWTAEAVSARLGFSRSKLSRVEAGEIPLPKVGDLIALLDEFGVTDEQERADLRQMQLDSRKSEPFTAYRAFLPSGLLRYLGLELAAVKVQGYENNVIHGLVQHEGYAAALMGSAKVVEERTTEAVQHSLKARMERKNLLVDDREVHIILTENTLRTLIGSAEIMREQYAEITRLCGLDNIDIQIIPEDMPTYRSGFSFTVLSFESLAPVVQSDGFRSTTMWSKPSDVGQFARQFETMAKAAPGPSETPRILKDLEEELWT
ncbi:helix-turn-helix domain-containing protein [Streptomyces anthocyanicus]|uniref:helix-turn-helix domain-containing protein n=1 Tax=Streptomyces anthocyanicus TaxID=68174 RepID=UPI003807D5B5